MPLAAWILGLAGAGPFIVAAAAATVGQEPAIRLYGYVALIAYSACMLSFLGAVHAGLALRENPLPVARLGIAAIAPALAWLSLALGERNGLLLMAAAYLGLLAYDIVAARRGQVPAWYPRLRWPLTGIVLVCLVAAMQSGPV